MPSLILAARGTCLHRTYESFMQILTQTTSQSRSIMPCGHVSSSLTRCFRLLTKLRLLWNLFFCNGDMTHMQVTVKQMESYCKSRYSVTVYLLNQPHTLCRMSALSTRKKPKAMSMTCSTQQEEIFLVSEWKP